MARRERPRDTGVGRPPPGSGAWQVESAHGDVEIVDGRRFHFDARAADRVCEFFRLFVTHHSGQWKGRPFVLERWQRLVARRAFGWLDEDGLRRYRTLFLFLPRKNGKTSFAAGLALYLLCGDNEPSAEVYSVAADREQARLTFGAAAWMIANAPPDLASRATPFRNSIVWPATGSTYQVLSSDAETKHGYSTHGAIIDELHAHASRDLFDVLVSSTGSRTQPMMVITTTAGFDRNSVCYEQYSYAKKVDEGRVVDASYLPVIFEAPRDADWRSEETWKACNPNWGVSLIPDRVREEFKRAVEIPGYVNTFKRLRLNMWTEQETLLIPMERWRECAGPPRTPAWWAALSGRDVFVGIDLSSTTDLTAMVGVFPDPERKTFDVLGRFWIPRDTAAVRAARDRVPYLDWIRDGYIDATEGAATDQTAIRVALDQWQKAFRVREVAADRWEATRLIGELEDEGYVAFAHGQGYAAMSEPTKALLRCILAGSIRHGGNPVLEWCAANCAGMTDPAGNIKPAKNRSSDRIDGVVALIMALGRASLVHEDPRSVYARRGRGLQIIGGEQHAASKHGNQGPTD